MRFFAVACFLVALAIASPIVEYMEPRGDAPDKKDIRIKSVSVSGTGCRTSTVWGAIGEDGTILTLTYPEYEISTSTSFGKTVPNARAFCNVRINLDYPTGWSYTVARAVISGYVNVPKMCSAKWSALFYFSGYNDEAECSVKFNGPVNKRFKEDAVVSTLVWSKCGIKGKEDSLFNINSNTSVDCKDAAYIGADTQDNKFKVKLMLQWKKC